MCHQARKPCFIKQACMMSRLYTRPCAAMCHQPSKPCLIKPVCCYANASFTRAHFTCNWIRNSFPLFIRFIQASVLGSSACTRTSKPSLLIWSSRVYTYTHTMEEMHAEFHCHCIPHSETRPCSTGVITRCQDKRYTATAVLTRTVDRAAVQRCMRSYQPLQPKPGV